MWVSPLPPSLPRHGRWRRTQPRVSQSSTTRSSPTSTCGTQARCSCGSKGVVNAETCATAVAALRLGRPVKWSEDRLENFLAAQQGRGLEADVELAVAADGMFLAVRARLYADLGAFLL